MGYFSLHIALALSVHKFKQKLKEYRIVNRGKGKQHWNKNGILTAINPHKSNLDWSWTELWVKENSLTTQLLLRLVKTSCQALVHEIEVKLFRKRYSSYSERDLGRTTSSSYPDLLRAYAIAWTEWNEPAAHGWKCFGWTTLLLCKAPT